MTREETARALWLWLSRESVAFDEPVIVRRIAAALAAERKAALEEAAAVCERVSRQFPEKINPPGIPGVESREGVTAAACIAAEIRKMGAE